MGCTDLRSHTEALELTQLLSLSAVRAPCPAKPPRVFTRLLGSPESLKRGYGLRGLAMLKLLFGEPSRLPHTKPAMPHVNYSVY